MSLSESALNPKRGTSPSVRRRWLRRVGFSGCGCGLALLLAVAGLLLLIANRVPTEYRRLGLPEVHPPNPGQEDLPGFNSPYIGHTGSWDGAGGAMGGRSKIPDLKVEQAMGLRWTFMPVYWRKLEPAGPVDLLRSIPAPWAELDSFVIEAHRRGLNILMQAPVIGGNAGGPPDWAGRREPGKSAPANMEAAADFAAKLADRYRPGGTLAMRNGWGKTYGVRAWELDNEPESYLTHWGGQAGDYAEFVTKVAARLKKVDPRARVVAPASAGGSGHWDWLAQTLNARALPGSPVFRQHTVPYSLGPPTDVVSFHIYEGMDSAFKGKDRTIELVLHEVRTVFDTWAHRVPGFIYAPKREYWQTEGNYDFLGLMSPQRRAAWRFQFFTRAFAAGVHKVVVMDASPAEQTAVRTYIQALPNPFPMSLAGGAAREVRGSPVVFRHPRAEGGQVWIAWARAGTGPATVELPAQHSPVRVFTPDGHSEEIVARSGRVLLQLTGDDKMAPPLLMVDAPPASEGRSSTIEQ